MRLETLINLRWLSIAGQSITLCITWFYFGYDFPFTVSMGAITSGVLLNILLYVRFSNIQRPPPFWAMTSLAFDIIQIAFILYMTGGLTNPFCVMLIGPVLLAAGSLPLRYTFFLGLAVIWCIIFLGIYHLPFPWSDQIGLHHPPLYLAGYGMGLIILMIFASTFIYHIAKESTNMERALSATELVLQRIQHISQLDGLAAAAAHELGTPLATIAVAAGEMHKEEQLTPSQKEDLSLILDQTKRCREILSRLSDPEMVSSNTILSALDAKNFAEEICAPHRQYSKNIQIKIESQQDQDIRFPKNPAIIYGVGNLLENAIDFAKNSVDFIISWDLSEVKIQIIDDGKGFDPQMLDKLGQPYFTTRGRKITSYQNERIGMGLGFFIAQTLLERSGAKLYWSNSDLSNKGAHITIIWPRDVLMAQN